MKAGRSEEDVADANLIESIREHARWQAGAGELIEHDGLLLYAGSNAYPGAYRNCAVRLDRNLDAHFALRRIEDFFGARGRGFTLWVRTGRDDDLETLAREADLSQVADGPCMLLTKPLPQPEVPVGVRVERFANEQTVRDAIGVNTEAYAMLGLPASETLATFRDPARLLSERVAGFVAYRDDRPLATALVLSSGQGAGLYWVGTTKDAQRTGLGGLCTRLATNAGFDRGARVVMLQASRFGEPLYARLGYSTYCRARWYRKATPL